MQGLFHVVEKLWPILKPFNSFFKSVAQRLFHIWVVFVPIKSCFTKFLGGGGLLFLFVCLFVCLLGFLLDFSLGGEGVTVHGVKRILK